MGGEVLLELVRACYFCKTGNRGGEHLMAILRNPMMVERHDAVKVVHIRFEGRSLDVPQGDLDVGVASSDNEIKRALARYLENTEGQLRDYGIDRHDTGQ